MIARLVPLSNAALEGGRGSARRRIAAVDLARGGAVAAMVVYHFAWNLSELRLIATEVTAEPGWRVFAAAIAASFLLLVGIGLALAHADRIRWRAFLQRLAIVAGAALLVTVATSSRFRRATSSSASCTRSRCRASWPCRSRRRPRGCRPDSLS
jgi:uncharacterized membrane protein